MSTINVKITDQVLEITACPKIAASGINENSMTFTFCDLWNGYTKIAMFWRDNFNKYKVALTNDACTIPNEVLASPGKVYFGVYGTSGTVRRTSCVLSFDVCEGSYSRFANNSVEPTQSVEDQVISLLNTSALITDISLTSTSGNVDTYTITLGSGTTYTFDVTNGSDGATGAAGTNGTNGISVTGAAINASGHLILTLSSGSTIDAGLAKGADGQGSGDMLKSTYDTTNNGVVDNAERFGGELPSYFATAVHTHNGLTIGGTPYVFQVGAETDAAAGYITFVLEGGS